MDKEEFHIPCEEMPDSDFIDLIALGTGFDGFTSETITQVEANLSDETRENLELQTLTFEDFEEAYIISVMYHNYLLNPLETGEK